MNGGWGGGAGQGQKRPPVFNISHTYPAMMKLATVIYTLYKENPKYIHIMRHSP